MSRFKINRIYTFTRWCERDISKGWKFSNNSDFFIIISTLLRFCVLSLLMLMP